MKIVRVSVLSLSVLGITGCGVTESVGLVASTLVAGLVSLLTHPQAAQPAEEEGGTSNTGTTSSGTATSSPDFRQSTTFAGLTSLSFNEFVPNSMEAAATQLTQAYGVDALDDLPNNGYTHLTQEVQGDEANMCLTIHRDAENERREQDSSGRQRVEIKVTNTSSNEYHYFENDTLLLAYDFELKDPWNLGFGFTHLLQLMPKFWLNNGSADYDPILNFSASKVSGGAEQFQLRFDPSTANDHLATAPWTLNERLRLTLRVPMVRQTSADNPLKATLINLATEATLMEYDSKEDTLEIWREREAEPGTTPFVRVKWGIYRRFNDDDQQNFAGTNTVCMYRMAMGKGE